MKSGFKSKEIPGEIPFSHGLENKGNLNERTRLKQYLSFIENLESPCLDIGEKNWIGSQIGVHFNVSIENTLKCDFNKEVVAAGKYKSILCFEVLEHVMNPALFLSNLKGLLLPGGTIYLSTPKLAVIPIYQTDMHFVEYKSGGLELMFQYCGFKIEKKKIFCPYPLWWGLTGFRPLFRVMYHRNFLYKLV